MLNVFFGVNESGVAWWRGKQPAWMLQDKGLANIMMFDFYRTTPEMTQEYLSKADVVYMPSPTGIEAILEYIKYYQLGKATIADYDDNLFDCHPLNPGYATLGLEEVKITLPDGTEEYLWKDQRHGFSLKDNRKRFMAHVDTLNVATLVSTTTPYLKQELMKNTERKDDDYVILPNSIDFRLFKPFDQKRRDHSKLRVGWAASDSHMLEGQMVMKIIKGVMDKRSDVQFVILNIEKFRFAAKDLPIEWHSFTDLKAYPLKLASLELDLGLCPLEDKPFNRSKSALKWSEYSALRIPSICSNLVPYHPIQDGKDGMLATTPEDFIEKICTIAENRDLGFRIANAAFDRNYEEYNLEKNVNKWAEVIEKAYILGQNQEVQYKGEPLKKFDEEESRRLLSGQDN